MYELTAADQTWIIIVLILISIVVTTFEVFLRFGLLSTRESSSAKALPAGLCACAGNGTGVGMHY